MLVIFLTVVLDLVGFGLVIPLLTFYAESFHATAFQVTSLMTCYSVAQFFAAPYWGQASDRFGRRPLLLLSILMTALMLAGFASAQSLWMLFAFRTLHGVMTANIAIAQACMADLTTPETRAKGMGLIGAGFGIGFTLGPFLGGELAQYGLTVPIWVAAGLSFVNFLLGLRYLPETRRPGSKVERRPINPLALLRAATHPVVGLCIALTFVFIFAFAEMESTFTLFAKHEHGLKPEEVGRLFGLIGVVGAVVQGGLIGRLVKRFGEAPLIPPGLLAVALGLALMPRAALGAPLLATFGCVAFGQGVVSPALQSLISRGVGPDEQGEILGSNQSMGALARAFGPIAGGSLFSVADPPDPNLPPANAAQADAMHFWHAVPFWLSAALLIVAALLSIPAGRRATSRREAG